MGHGSHGKTEAGGEGKGDGMGDWKEQGRRGVSTRTGDMDRALSW